jgi:hypothetical protein
MSRAQHATSTQRHTRSTTANVTYIDQVSQVVLLLLLIHTGTKLQSLKYQLRSLSKTQIAQNAAIIAALRPAYGISLFMQTFDVTYVQIHTVNFE